MIVSQYEFNKIEKHTQIYNTILYLQENKTIYLIKEDIKEIDTYKSNKPISDNFFILYSKKWLTQNDTTDNITNVIKSKNMIQPHIKDNIIKCFKCDTVILDIENIKRQKCIIDNIDRYLTIYYKVKRHIDNILNTLPKTHYSGATQIMARKSFEKNLMPMFQGHTTIELSQLPEGDAAVLGSAAVMWEAIEEEK